MVLPTGASAAECTDNYTGPAEGAWTTAANWSAGHVPGATDVACIGSGKSAKFSNGGKTSQVAVVQGEGSLNISAGSLELKRLPSEGESVLALLTMGGGTLMGAGKLTVTKTLSWNSGSMSGTSTTVLAAGAAGTITNAHMSEHTLVNEGSLSLPSRYLAMSDGARLENSGTFTINTEGSEFGLLHPTGAAPLIVNTGTIRKTAGTGESLIKVGLVNFGLVKAESGTISFPSAEPVTLLSSSTLEGAIKLSGPAVTAGAFSMPSGTLTLQSGSLSVESGYTASVAGLALKGGTLEGGGTLSISSALNWTGGKMAGAGHTVLSPSATASVSNVFYDERTLVNEGSLTVSGNYLSMGVTAVLENAGTLTVNAEGTETGITHPAFKPGAILVNTGTLRKAGGAGTTTVKALLANQGTVRAETGTLNFAESGVALLTSGSSLVGGVKFQVDVLGEGFTSSGGPMTIGGLASLTIPGGATAQVSNLSLTGTKLEGGGRLEVTTSLTWENSTMEGSGETMLAPGATGSVYRGKLDERTLVNEGTMTLASGYLSLRDEATFENEGTFNANTEGAEFGITESGEGASLFLNTGLFQKTAGTGTTEVEAPFNNSGVLKEASGHLDITDPVTVKQTEQFGNRSCSGDPVECATGNFTEAQTDFAVGGLGVGLSLTRTYSAQAAAAAGAPGAFGYGWTGSFSDHLTVEEGGAKVTLVRGNGSTIPFTRTSGTAYAGPAWSQETLSGSPEAGYAFTALDQTEYRFSGAGRLEAISDRNGNETTLAYDEAGRLKSVTDPSGRHLTFAYNGAGQVETATDPMGHVVKYGYEGGNLTAVTMPGETSPRWQFKYDGSHRITQVTDGRGGKTTNEYDGESRVVSQTDPAGRTLTFKYEAFHTTITDKATGAVTDKWFTSDNEPFQITYGYGTPQASTETFSYNAAGRLTRRTDGNGHSTTYGYDAAGNRTSERDPLGHETKWTFDGTHDVISTTTPRGETTTIERDADGNVERISRPAPGEATQTTTFAHDEHGRLESLTDPLGHTWTYGYDAYGDRTSETDPLGDEQTIAYDADSRLTAITSPRGNPEGAEPAQYTTSVERDPQGRPTKVTDQLGSATKYAYDPNGNLASVTDAKGHTTKYTYNADDERTKVEKPSGATLETGYDGAGYVSSQTDGRGKTTTYVRNVLEQPVEVVDPLGRKTLESFDAAGNLAGLTDPAERKTTYSYDAAGRLTALNYSEEATPDASFEYDPDGNVVAINDGTGKSSYAYDQLSRLTRSENGHGEAVEYSYNLGEEQTGLVYPNGKALTRAYDAAGRLESLTDWLGGTTSFGYDADSNLTGVVFPSASGNHDEYSYDRASRISAATFKKSSETLASLGYVRDSLGQVEKEARSGLPGPEEVKYGYDQNNRLTEAGPASFEYDAADNLTKGIGSTNAYDAAAQLETGTGLTYGYDKLGERTKTTPASGPATTYGYDQAGNLISVSRPEEGEVPAIAETMTYDATGLLAAKTSGLTTRHLSWDQSSGLPLLLADGENSYVNGPNGLPIEQISSGEEPTYLHHDQLGSTRVLTDASGKTSATYSYQPYGGLEGKTGTATTPLGFAGQYTDATTGLQYLRARFYDPATGQFLSRDPLQEVTWEPYGYAANNPANLIDLTGQEVAVPALNGASDTACSLTWEVPGVDAVTCGAAGATALGSLADTFFGNNNWLAEAEEHLLAKAKEEAEGDPCLRPPVDPWEYETEVGDGKEGQLDAGRFAAKLGTSETKPDAPGPGGSPKAKAIKIAALLAMLYEELRHH